MNQRTQSNLSAISHHVKKSGGGQTPKRGKFQHAETNRKKIEISLHSHAKRQHKPTAIPQSKEK
ncbi:MAG: hypothetical protein EBT57_01130 [Verrucomicrobia bacterium]|nr:hypothetical protein [Verrucomicrobiota bacterium]